jgi:hypothetical protein
MIHVNRWTDMSFLLCLMHVWQRIHKKSGQVIWTCFYTILHGKVKSQFKVSLEDNEFKVRREIAF